MSLNDINVNMQVDILRNGSGPDSLLARIPLADLTASSSQVHIWHAFDSKQRMEAVQGPGDITYFAGASTLSKDKIVSWDPYTNYVFVHEIDHSSIPNCDHTVAGTDGKNWYGRFGIWPGGVESATASGKALYVAHGTGREYCSDPMHPLFAQPAIFVATYDLTSWKATGEKWMWHPTLALGYPAMQTDGAGDVGIAYRAAASGQNPVPVASFFSPDGQSVIALGAGGPHDAGDYYSLRPGQTPQSFVMTALTVVGGVKHWDYIEYGRGAAPFVAPPDVTIATPKDGANFDQGATVTYTALVYDPVWGSLPANALVWTEDGIVIGHGPQITHTEAIAGKHTITLTATNGDDKSSSQSITINVQAPPPAGAPVPSITSPADSSSFCAKFLDAQSTPYQPVAFQAMASDPNAPPQALSYSWTDSVNGGAATQVSTELSPTLNLYYVSTGGTYSPTAHDLTLTATNTSGKSGSKTIRVYIEWPCID